MTAQEIFDQVAKHLLSMSGRSMNKDEDGSESCAYRGEGGSMCAVGCLITDEEYDPRMDNNVYATGVFSIQSYIPERLQDHLGLLSQLQEIHDDSESEGDAFRAEVFDGLERLAEERFLDRRVLDEWRAAQ